MKRWFVFLMTMLLLLGASALAEITSVEQLNHGGIKVGTELGCAAELTIRQELPEAALEQYNDKNLGYADVANGRLDAFIFDRTQMLKAIEGGVKGVRLLDENMGDVVKVAVGISPVSAIPDLERKINQFIAELRADGTLDEMYKRWVIDGNEEMPKIDLPDRPELHLIVGTSGIVPPYSYYVGTRLNGHDVELAYRLAAWLNADLEFKVYDYGAIVPAALSGDVDCVIANLNVTPERAEVLPFSDTLYEVGVGVMVRGETPTESPVATYRRVGIQTGSSFDAIISEKMPDAEAVYFNTKADLVAALDGDKIDTFVVDEPVAKILMRENDRLTFLPDYLDTFSFALVFPNSDAGKALRDQFNGFLETLRADGTLDALEEKWFSEDEDAKTMPDIAALSAENGTLRVATEAAYNPFEYMRDGAVVGYDMELAARFCEACGYGLEIVDMSFESILPSVQAGKCDLAASAITVTPERAQSILFSEPYFYSGTVLMVLKQSDENTIAPGDFNGKSGFLESLGDSFKKTFLRENRWRLFLTGVMNTLIITILSILFGTALGFAVYMLCRNGNPVANGITRFCTWLVQGMPMVVLLMILYYVIFGSVSISGIAVAVIGFAFTFGSAVFGLLRMGVGAVDGGQYEAACALGYSNRRTFYRIILPQAAPHILPAYKGEVVGLIKATSIVGYIAVQDLTKMGDIVRSRTYEAFFPLIAVTIIYFLLEGLIGFFVSRISVCFNPKRRKPDEILKGIRIDGQD